MYMLQLSLFTACSHPLKKKYRKKNTLHKWNVLQQKNFKLGYFIFLHKSPKKLILDPLKRNKKKLHLSSNISASKTAFKHRISSSIYSMTECSRKVGVWQNYAIQSHLATYLLVIFLSVELQNSILWNQTKKRTVQGSFIKSKSN